MIMLLVPIMAHHSAAQEILRPTMALVLSGGGARGLAQIGILKAFDEAGIKPDLIVGTSMGAIIGSLYACGYSADSIESFARSVDWNAVFANSATRKRRFVSQKAEPANYLFEMRFDYNFKPILPSSISFGQAFYDILGPRLATAQFHARMNFDSLPIPLRIITTDILSGDKVVFSKGSLTSAVRASCGVPLAFSPVYIDSMMLMDGGLTSNIPVQVARDHGVAVVVAVDVTSSVWSRSDLDNPVRLVERIVSIGVGQRLSAEREMADYLVTPDLSGFSNTDFRKMDTLIARGYTAALDSIETLKRLFGALRPSVLPPVQPVLPQIKWICHDSSLAVALDSAYTLQTGAGTDKMYGCRPPIKEVFESRGQPFSRLKQKPVHDSLMLVTVDPGTLESLVISGNQRTSPRMIYKASGIKPGDTLSPAMLHKAMQSVYSTDLFENVNIDVDPTKQARIMVEEKKYWRMRLGLRFDEFHLGEAYIQPAYENLFGLGICALAHLQYGLRREKYALELQGTHLFTSNLAISHQFQGYISRERVVIREIIDPDSLRVEEKTLRKTGIIALAGTQIGRSAMLNGGIKLERYKIQQSDNSAFGDALGFKFTRGLPYFMLRLTIDTMDKFPFPKVGWKHYFTIGGSSENVGSSESFFKASGSFGRYFTLLRKHTFFTQLRLAWSSSQMPEVEKVYLGGAIPEERYRDMGVYNYIPFTGLHPRAFPGDCLGLIHLDYRFSVWKNLYLESVFDWGYAWDRNHFVPNRSVEEFAERAPVGIGAGLNYESLFGPIRFQYGQLLHNFSELELSSEPVFYFSVGYDF
jgi:predicted acylesterase/phospholipase RssA/outer membrane translocation and assembly module TamA